MLTNKFSKESLKLYKKTFLESFKNETLESVNYFFEKCIKEDFVYVSVDDQNDLQLGLVLIPNEVVINNKNFSSILIYGLVGGKKYKGTGILKKVFPKFLEEIKSKYDFVFIQSEFWKIYDEFDFIPVSKNNLYVYEKIDHFTANIYYQCNDDLVRQMLSIYQNQINNFKIQNYLKHDLNSMKKLISLNLLSGDRIYLVPGAYAFFSSSLNQAYLIAFESKQAFEQLLESLPYKLTISLNNMLKIDKIRGITKIDEIYKTKILKPKNQSLGQILFD